MDVGSAAPWSSAWLFLDFWPAGGGRLVLLQPCSAAGFLPQAVTCPQLSRRAPVRGRFGCGRIHLMPCMSWPWQSSYRRGGSALTSMGWLLCCWWKELRRCAYAAALMRDGDYLDVADWLLSVTHVITGLLFKSTWRAMLLCDGPTARSKGLPAFGGTRKHLYVSETGTS